MLVHFLHILLIIHIKFDSLPHIGPEYLLQIAGDSGTLQYSVLAKWMCPVTRPTVANFVINLYISTMKLMFYNIVHISCCRLYEYKHSLCMLLFWNVEMTHKAVNISKIFTNIPHLLVNSLRSLSNLHTDMFWWWSIWTNTQTYQDIYKACYAW